MFEGLIYKLKGKSKESQNKTQRKRTETKTPSVVIRPNKDKSEVHPSNIKLSDKLNSYKTQYSIRDFELLASRGRYQEAYWAAILLKLQGVALDKATLEHIALVVELHWPEMMEETLENWKKQDENKKEEEKKISELKEKKEIT